jgi:tRNA dimethylallyltransferase
MKKILVLCGPTASGKTKLSIYLSKLFDCEIINADSRQIYRYMNIGTAKPTEKEMSLVYHNFVDIIDPDQHYDAGIFGQEGRIKINEILKDNKVPLVVGGSGLYIRSLIDGLFDGPARDENIRQMLEERIKTEGTEPLYAELLEKDPESAQKLDPTKTHRLIRALEVFYLTQKPISELQKQYKLDIDFTPVFFGLNWPRDILYDRVNSRSEEMVLNGLIEETCNLVSMGYDKNLKALQTVGYKECFEYLEGKYDRNEMIRLIKQNTRHYVKGQMTWFNHDERINWITVSSDEEFEKLAIKILKDFKFSID